MISYEDLKQLLPGDEVVLKDTSNGKELKAWYKSKTTKGEMLIYVERFKDVMKLKSDGSSGLGRFYIARRAR